MSVGQRIDHIVIGGGFYGCCLALFLKSVSRNVVLLEANERLLNRASRVNQARVHTGFHYPRSTLTAVKSLALHRRFAADFPDAIHDDFQMLYAIARYRSRVSSNRFLRMFSSLDAPIRRAPPASCSLFDMSRIEEVFSCREVAFDYVTLRAHLERRLADAGVDVRLRTTVARLDVANDVRGGVHVVTSTGSALQSSSVFNVTYANTNALLATTNLPLAPLKYELAEVALIKPPPVLARIGVTVMDGPFFSTMPYPAEQLHSLTHVRYTPQASWTDGDRHHERTDPSAVPQSERARHMLLDAARYLPCLADATWERSLWETKAILLRNEADDGRPILYQQRHADPRVTTVVGGKVDNVYDLFEAVRTMRPELAAAHDGLIHGRRAPG